jgi:hypothetical protein
MNRHPNTKGLKPFKPGAEWTGNASGRPKKRPITDEYFQLSQNPIPEKLRNDINSKLGEELLKPGATWAQANALRRFLDTLMQGGHPSSKEIREAIEGKAPERLEITGPERKEITLHLIHEHRSLKQKK